MQAKSFIGIDVGTTSVKAAVIDTSGSILARFCKDYPTSRSGAAVVEQDATHWTQLIDAALASFAGHEVAAICITSQVNTHVFVDQAGAAVAPAIVWQDGRAATQAAELEAHVSAKQKQAWWGAPMPIDASHACARMAWMVQERPEIWAKTQWVMLPKDYCMHHLTGVAATDPISNIGLIDQQLQLIPELLELVPDATGKIVRFAPICDVVGQVTNGPFKGVPVVNGAMDAWAGLIGAGGAKDGSTLYLSGTSEILGVSSHKIIPTAGAVVFSECEGIRLHAAPTQSGGDAKRWFADTHGLTLPQMSDLVALNQRSDATPLFLPQLQGERAPLWDADLRAAFLGISRQTTQSDFARAVYEGVAMAARMGLEVLQASSGVVSDSVTCGGGGFLSDPWCQIRADVLGKELNILANQDPGVLGASLMAAVGVGHYNTLADAFGQLVKIGKTISPNTDKRAFYDDLFCMYGEAIQTNASLGKRLTRLSSRAVS